MKKINPNLSNTQNKILFEEATEPPGSSELNHEKRDQLVIRSFYQKKTPICGVLGGGYNKDFDKLIELHSSLHKNCKKILNEKN